MNSQSIVHKVPGVLSSVKSEHYIQDLTKLERILLLEIKEREEKLMSRIPNLNKLPDKGQRIKDFYEKVCKELERRDNMDDVAEKFSEMNIASKAKTRLNDMEWSGKLSDDCIADVIDSDDEAEMDPLKILAQRTMHEKKVNVEQVEQTLVTQTDIEDIQSFAKESDVGAVVNAEVVSIDVGEKLDKLKPKLTEIAANKNVNQEDDLHTQYLIHKGDDLQSVEEKFMPYRTTKSDVHNPTKERQRKVGERWENTAATPPLIRHEPAKLLTLTDSLEIQKDYLAKLKALQEKQAAERLSAKLERIAHAKIELPSDRERQNNPIFTEYRVPKVQQMNIDGVQQFDEDDQVEDVDDEKPGGVVYTLHEYD